jgi:hypothetical protein
MTVFDKIKEANRLTRMRLGQEAPQMVTLMAHPEVRLAMVPLVERETQAGVLYAAGLGYPDNASGLNASNRAVVHSDLWHALRDPDDFAAKAFPSIEAMTDELAPEEIDNLADELMALMDYASPTADGISEEQLVVLKKAFATIEWSGLSGRRWALLKMCLSTFAPELLAASLSGSGSTDSLTLTNENDESTSNAFTS